MSRLRHAGVLAAALVLARVGVAAELTLAVLVVEDPDFPPIDKATSQAILDEANRTFVEKFGFGELAFADAGRMSAADFVARYAGNGDCLAQLESFRVGPGGRKPSAIPKEAVVAFLKRWPVESLRSFFPGESASRFQTHDDVYAALIPEFEKKLELIAGFRLANGSSLLAPEKLPQRSYVHWTCAMRYQDVADLVLTNAFLLYDLGSEPYPHSIFAKNKVGGASLPSHTRKAIPGRAVVASTFSMATDIPFFQETGVEALSTKQRLEVIGTFIVAHELGHAVFKLPDFYDHPSECLMTTKLETGYVDGYRDMKAHPGACTKCQPYIEARRHVFVAQAARDQRRFTDAIDQYRLAIERTPKHIDGNYRRYVADLAFEIARAYFELGDKEQAKNRLKSVLKVAPDHTGAQDLQRRLTGDSAKP